MECILDVKHWGNKGNKTQTSLQQSYGPTGDGESHIYIVESIAEQKYWRHLKMLVVFVSERLGYYCIFCLAYCIFFIFNIPQFLIEV